MKFCNYILRLSSVFRPKACSFPALMYFCNHFASVPCVSVFVIFKIILLWLYLFMIYHVFFMFFFLNSVFYFIYSFFCIQLFRQRLSKQAQKRTRQCRKVVWEIVNKHVKSSESILFLLTHTNKY